MNSRIASNILPKWSALLVFCLALAVASAFASGPPKGGGGGGGGSHPAPAAHSAPAQHSAPSHPSGGGAGARPGGNASHAGGNSGSRPAGGAASQNRGPGGAASQNRGATGNASRPGQTGANRGGQTAGGNRGGQTAGGNHGGQNAGGNRGGANAGGNRGGQTAGGNRGGQSAGGNRGGANAGNRGGAGAHQPAGSRNVSLKGGGHATVRANGSVRSIQSHGMTINRGMHGGRSIRSVHNGRTIVSHGRYGGYSQRAYFNRGGRAYVQRTYYRGGRYYAYGYRSYYWGGRPYFGYAPAYYWHPGFYGWAWNPWPGPVYWGVGAWGWGGAPWWGYYGPWFTPYPFYAGAAFWLTDWFIAANLQAAYAAQQAAGDGGDQGAFIPMHRPDGDEVASLWSDDPLIAAYLPGVYGAYMLGGGADQASGPPMSKDVKDALAEEMKYEIGAEKEAAAAGGDAAPANPTPAAVDPKIHIFVVSSDEDLTTADGVECTLTAGDVLDRTTTEPDGDNMVNAVVKSAKKDECAVGATVGVSTDDLQEMHNQLRIQLDAGLKELADKQGKNGMPAAPDTKTTDGEVPAPQADTSVQADLQQQAKDADAAEAEAKQPQQ